MSEEESPPAQSLKQIMEIESWSWAQYVRCYVDVTSNKRVENPPFVYEKNVEYKFGCFKYGDKILSGPVPYSTPLLDCPPSFSHAGAPKAEEFKLGGDSIYCCSGPLAIPLFDCLPSVSQTPNEQATASEQAESESDSEYSEDDLPYLPINDEEWKRDCEKEEIRRKKEDQAIRDEMAREKEKQAKKRRLETSVPYPSYQPRDGNYKYQVWYKKGAPDGFQLDPAFEICEVGSDVESESHKMRKYPLAYLLERFLEDPAFKISDIDNDEDSATIRMMKFALTLLPLMGIETSGESKTVFNEHFILTRVGTDNMEVDDIFFRRCVERSVKDDPPLLLEIMEQFYFYSDKKGQKHPIAEFYPPSYTYEMIEYCEDPYWTKHQGELPGRLKYPQKRVTWVDDPPTPAQWKEIVECKYSDIKPGGEMFVLNFAETKQELKCCVGFGLELGGCSEKPAEVEKPKTD